MWCPQCPQIESTLFSLSLFLCKITVLLRKRSTYTSLPHKSFTNVMKLFVWCFEKQSIWTWSVLVPHFKPVLNWANVSSRTWLEVFGEAIWFLIRPTFLREPSWKYSSKLYSGPKSFAQHVLGTFTLLDNHCLWLAESRALMWMKKK